MPSVWRDRSSRFSTRCIIGRSRNKRIVTTRRRYLDGEKTDRAGAAARIRKGARYDQRWVCIHRPLIVGGSELTLKDLDLVFDPTTKYYEAPTQMKANGGVFLMDDLGRQRFCAASATKFILPTQPGQSFARFSYARRQREPSRIPRRACATS